MEVTADAEVQNREQCASRPETPTWWARDLSEEETKYSLFDVESSPGSSTVTAERIVAPNGAGFMIYTQSLR